MWLKWIGRGFDLWTVRVAALVVGDISGKPSFRQQTHYTFPSWVIRGDLLSLLAGRSHSSAWLIIMRLQCFECLRTPMRTTDRHGRGHDDERRSDVFVDLLTFLVGSDRKLQLIELWRYGVVYWLECSDKWLGRLGCVRQSVRVQVRRTTIEQWLWSEYFLTVKNLSASFINCIINYPTCV